MPTRVLVVGRMARYSAEAGCQPAKQQTANLRYGVAPIVNRLYRRLVVSDFAPVPSFLWLYHLFSSYY